MNTFLQILSKLILTFFVLMFALSAVRSLWNTSIDFKRLVSLSGWFEKGGSQTWSFLPSRAPDKVYLNGEELVTVSGVKIDRRNGMILFERMTGPDNWTTNIPVPNAPGIPKTFEYLDFLIQYVTLENANGAGMDVAYGNATFKIVGKRKLW